MSNMEISNKKAGSKPTGWRKIMRKLTRAPHTYTHSHTKGAQGLVDDAPNQAVPADHRPATMGGANYEQYQYGPMMPVNGHGYCYHPHPEYIQPRYPVPQNPPYLPYPPQPAPYPYYEPPAMYFPQAPPPVPNMRLGEPDVCSIM